MSTLLVIPARYASSRFPGKPLVPLKGATRESASLIERTWRAGQEVSGVDRAVVATDDDRIAEACAGFGADVVMTTSACKNGTERCAEVLAQVGPGVDAVVNLQGDAPLTPPWFIEALIEGLSASGADIATPVLRCSGQMLGDLKADRQAGRVGGTTAVFSHQRQALYFSKEVIPFTSDAYAAEAPTPVYHHVGVYAYRPDALAAYPDWPVGPLEELEGLEQLRFLEQNRSVHCVEVDARGREFWELNNPSDVDRLESIMARLGIV